MVSSFSLALVSSKSSFHLITTAAKSMLITFLGHQGWAFGDQDGIVLLDPLLQSMNAGPVDLPVWPPRRLDFAAMPRIKGLVISHEHPDHFDIETLLNLPYRGDVWIPDLSTSALATCLRELGFVVRRYGAFQSFVPGAGIEASSSVRARRRSSR
jgi:hypothetical protein